ncbi:Tic20 family protein [Almyronema epifaneia]|uniref:Tic20 family protein n=1 Tax=Almyronema epifaneia S1 TaxID=2991925 RepID=A0ABW6IE35_9CYAN
MNWRGSTTVSDRIFAALPYILPLVYGIGFGVFIFRDFPIVQLLLVPLTPFLAVYNFPFAGIIIFFLLFFLVVRNPDISHFIRFNTMQAILLDIILFLCQLVFGLLAGSLGEGLLVQTLSNVIFLGMLAAVVYSVAQSLMGRYAEIPTLSEAVHMQVR